MQVGLPADKLMNTSTDKQRPLSYRLRKSVQFDTREDAPVLILDYPLKATKLDPFWTLAFESLSEGHFIPIERITSLLQDSDTNDVRFFLDNLVRKGFLEREGIPELSNLPLVSVIIPVRNRPEEIRACLDSLQQLDFPADKLEIIVVDDASTDGTPEVASGYPVRLIKLEEHKQASYCRNLAAQQASGDILAFIDSDCLASRSWLKELLPAFQDSSLAAVGGLVDASFEEKGLDRYEKVKSSLNMGIMFKRTQKNDHFFYVPTCNLLVKKGVFLDLSGFSEDLVVGEDVDFCWRLQDAGYYLEYQPLGKVYHKHRNRLRDFCFRRFDYGGSEPMLQKRHPGRRKTLFTPPTKIFFWTAVCISLVTTTYSPILVALITFLMDILSKGIRSQRSGIDFRFTILVRSVIREYATFIYHLGSFLSRYYLFIALLLLPVFPMISAVGLCAHLLTMMVEYKIKRPRLTPVSFLFYFTLEQLSYQLGVWAGCLRYRTFNPILPRLVFRRQN
jgi:mycofactocin glycosyltransferase